MAIFIPDGYTEDGYYEGKFGGLAFRFRPVTGSERAEARAKMYDPGLESASKPFDELLVDHLVSWNIKHEGKPVEISVENMRRLDDEYRTALIDIACRERVSSPRKGEKASAPESIEDSQGNSAEASGS